MVTSEPTTGENSALNGHDAPMPEVSGEEPAQINSVGSVSAAVPLQVSAINNNGTEYNSFSASGINTPNMAPGGDKDDYGYKLSMFPGYYKKLSAADKKKFYFVHDDHSTKKQYFNAAETAKRFKYLLGLTGLFSHFINSKAAKDPKFQEVLDILERDEKEAALKKKSLDHRRRKTEKEEDAELMKDEKSNGNSNTEENDNESVVEFTESPGYINGQLRPYQILGLNWLISLSDKHLSGILADEMGLGKTLQTISFLGYLRYIKCIQGPYLVIVPKSTLDNWSREFKKWTPEVKTVVLTGDQQQRNEIINGKLLTCDFDVIISSYEIVIREKSTLKKFQYEQIIVDEAHRLKNEESQLSQIIRMFYSKRRLLITGTPLQNNLHELWALLNFILPDIFSDSTTFDEWFSSKGDNNSEDGEEKEKSPSVPKEDDSTVINQLHKVLQPFLLRRIKSDVETSLLPKKEINVYLGMSDMQKRWYQKILEKDIDAVNGANLKKESKTRLLNIVMQLRKCCNHPYLFEGAEPGPPFTTDEHLVFNSQKMKVLDKLLTNLRKQGSRVLIFSQMSRMLDILEDYCVFREYEYCRIDGQTDHVDRIQAIDDYNEPDSKKFVFLLTTRAGGLGINLTSADVVVLYDSDWNPQADLQAMDRAHRIGQKKQVKVFRFVTENAIEEKVLERASQKLRLDQLVIQQGRNAGKNANDKNTSKDELLNMIQHGAVEVLSSRNDESNNGNNDNKDSITSSSNEISDDEIEKLLQKSEQKTQELNSKYSKLGLDDLQNFTSNGNNPDGSDSVYEWDGKKFEKKQAGGLLTGATGSDVNHYLGYSFMMNPTKRERKENYSIDGYYREVLNTGGRPATPKIVGPKAPKHLSLQDHQFYPAKLYELYDRETYYYKKLLKSHQKNQTEDEENNGAEIQQIDKDLEEYEIENSRKLTELEEELKKELITQGFGNWSRRDFFYFIQMNAKYGRNSVDAIVEEMKLYNPEKTDEDVIKYIDAFWKRYHEIDGFEKYINTIEQGEEKLRKYKLNNELLRRKVTKCKNNPLVDISLKFPPANSTFSKLEDNYLIVQMFVKGFNTLEHHNYLYESIKNDIATSELFKLNFFFQSRTPLEINRRCNTLMGCLLKEFEDDIPSPDKKDKKSKNKKRKAKEIQDSDDGADDDSEEEASVEAPARKKPGPKPKAKTESAPKGKPGPKPRGKSAVASKKGKPGPKPKMK